jgi:hypothetical protein
MLIGARPMARARVPADNSSVILVDMRSLPPPAIISDVAMFNRVTPETLLPAFLSIG